MGPSVEGMLTLCSNRSASLNKMAAMPIYGITLKILFSSTKKAMRLNLGIQNRGLTKFIKTMRLG